MENYFCWIEINRSSDERGREVFDYIQNRKPIPTARRDEIKVYETQNTFLESGNKVFTRWNWQSPRFLSCVPIAEEYKKGPREFPGQPTPFMRGNALSSVGSKVKTIIHAEQESTWVARTGSLYGRSFTRGSSRGLSPGWRILERNLSLPLSLFFLFSSSVDFDSARKVDN